MQYRTGRSGACMSLCKVRRSGTTPQWLAEAMSLRNVMRDDRLATETKASHRQPSKIK